MANHSSSLHFQISQILPSVVEQMRMARRLTKKEIVKTISEELGVTQLQTKEVVQRTFDAIIDALVTDPDFDAKKGIVNRIELRNFGVFEVKKRAARLARNPKTGEQVHVPEKFVVTFKPGKEMEEKVRQLEDLSKAHDQRNASESNEASSIPPVPLPSAPPIPPIRSESDSQHRENSNG